MRSPKAAVVWLAVCSLQLSSLQSRQSDCALGLSCSGTWAVVVSGAYFLLWGLGPLVTAVSLFAVLADDGHGRRTAMGLRRVAVTSPCLTHLVTTLLQPGFAPRQNWWLWPLASAALALTNKDDAEVTAVQASVLYTLSVASVAIDFARRTWQAATTSVATSAAAGIPAALLPPGLLSQLLGRVATLAALHVLLAVSGIWGATGDRRGVGAASGSGRRRDMLPQAKQREAGVPEERPDWGRDLTVVQPQRLFASFEGGFAASLMDAEGLLLWRGDVAAAGAVGAADAEGVTAAVSSIGSARGDGGAGAVTGAGGFLSPVHSLEATATSAAAAAAAAAGVQQAWRTQQQQEQQGGMQARCYGWHGDLAAERRQVAAARLADAALLAYDFLEASRCFCGALVAAAAPLLRPPVHSSGGGGGIEGLLAMAGSGAGAAALPRLLGPVAGTGAEGSLRQLRCLGALLVTSWGATVLVMNAIVILWPRPRRSSYAWILNSACSWLAGLSRAAMLVLLAPPFASWAAWTPGTASGTATAAASDWPSTADVVVVSGGGGAALLPATGRPALAATVVLLSHLIASNLSLGGFSIQAGAAAAAGALLHSCLAPASPAPSLAVVYGGVWVAAVTLSYSLARACRQSQTHDGVAAAAAALQQEHQQHASLQQCCVTASAAGGAAAVAAAGSDTEKSVEVLPTDPSPAGINPRRLRPPRLGSSVSRTFSSADGSTQPGSVGGYSSAPAAAAAAASDLALRTLSRSPSPRLSGWGQPPYPRSHSGASSCSARAQDGHPLQPAHSRPGSMGRQVPAAIGYAGPGPGTSSAGGAAPPAVLPGLGIRGAGRPASGEPAAPPRRPPPLQLPNRALVDPPSVRLLPPCRTSSMEPRHEQRSSSVAPPAPPAAVVPSPPQEQQQRADTAAGLTAVGDTCSPFGETAASCIPRCGVSPDLPAAARATGEAVSYMRRVSSERPAIPQTPASAPPLSLLQQAYSCGPPPQASDAYPLGLVVRESFTAATAATRAVPAWKASAAARAVCGGGGGSEGEEPGGAVGTVHPTGQGSAAPLPRMLTPTGSVPIAGSAAASGGGGSAVAAANDHSVLSAIILEADAYDRLLSSASSPFLLNPVNATTTTRLPSTANTGTLPLLAPALASPTLVDRRAQKQQQPQQQQALLPPYRTSSGFSETWSAFGSPGPTSGGGSFVQGAAAAAAGAAAAAASALQVSLRHRQAPGSAAEDRERRSGDLGPESGGWGRAATGSRSRLDRVATAAAMEETLPRQVIVLADGRQVYQSELLAAAMSASPPGSATPLRSLPGYGSAAERPWVAAGRDLLSSMAHSEPDALSQDRTAAATAASAVTRHFSYTVRGGGGGAGGGGGRSSSLDPMSSSPASYSQHSARAGSGAQLQVAAAEVGARWAAMGAMRAPPAQSPWQSQPQLQRAVSVGMSPAAATYGGAAAASASARDDQGFGFAQPSLFVGNTSGRSSYTPRGGVGGGAGAGGASASSRVSNSYGPASGASSSGGALTMGGTSGPTSYGTVETGGSLSGGAGGSGSSGGNRGGGAVPYPRGSMDLGRHLHDTGLIRIGEEEAVPENDEGEYPASTLFGTCDDGGGGGRSLSAVDERFPHSGGGFCNLGYGSESDRRSSAADRPSNGTISSEAPPARLAPGSYGSSSVGSGAVGGLYGSGSVGSGPMGDAPRSAPLVAAGVQPAWTRPGGWPRAGRVGSTRQQHHSVTQTQDAPAAGAAASAPGSSWSAPGRWSAADGPHGGGGNDSAGRLGSGASGASQRELSDSPTLQSLLHIQSHTVASSSDLFTQLPTAAAVVAAAAAAATGSGGGSAAGSGAAAVSSGRHLGSGGSYRSSSNPSMLSFADVTLGFNPGSPTEGPAHNNTGSHGQSVGAAALSGQGIVVTLACGVVANSPLSSGPNRADDGDENDDGGGGLAPRRQAAGACASGATADGGAGGGSVCFLSYPQTLATMAGLGSMGRGGQAPQKAAGSAAAAAGAAPHGSGNMTTACSSSGRLGFWSPGGGGGDARGGSRPTIPELLASTAAAAAAIGTAPGCGGGGGASPWASPASSAMPLLGAGSNSALSGAVTMAQLPAGAAAAAAVGAPDFAAMNQRTLQPYRQHLNLFTAEEVSSGAENATVDGSYSTGADSHPAGDMAVARVGSTTAIPSQRLSQPLLPGRRRGMSWFGHFLAPKRTSTIGTSGGGGSGFLAGVGYLASLADVPPPSQSAPQPQPEYQSYDRSPYGGGGEVQEEADGARVSATAGGGGGGGTAGMSSQQLTRLMDDTARLSPVRGVLRGIRKRFRSGVKSLSGGRQ